MLVRLVVACFELDQCELRLGVVQEQIVDLLCADLLCSCGCADVNAGCLVAATAQKGDALQVNAASLRADGALLNLRSSDALKWEKVAAYVVEHLDGVPVHGVDFISQLEQGDYRVGVDF